MERMASQNIDSKFRLILLASDRAERLLRGARPKIEFKSIKVARGAMEEVLQGLIGWEYGPAPAPEVAELDESSLDGEAPASE